MPPGMRRLELAASTTPTETVGDLGIRATSAGPRTDSGALTHRDLHDSVRAGTARRTQLVGAPANLEAALTERAAGTDTTRYPARVSESVGRTPTRAPKRTKRGSARLATQIYGRDAAVAHLR
jgi:hypothetical protein